MTTDTDQGRAIERVETFVVSHTLNPRTGPSIALSSTHAYVLVKLTDSDGRSGWGRPTSCPASRRSSRRSRRSSSAGRLQVRGLARDIGWAAEHTYAASALTIAVEDLRARQLGVSVAESFGGPVRDKVRLYAAFGGYVEGVDPADTWPGDVERVLAAGFTAMKFRVGRYPVAHEAALLEKIRSDLPDGVVLMADGNAGYTLPRAIEMGGSSVLSGSSGSRSRSASATATRATSTSGPRSTSRSRAARSSSHGAPRSSSSAGVPSTSSSPSRSSVAGWGHLLDRRPCGDPHDRGDAAHVNNALGIAAGLQVLACLPDPTRSPASDELFLEVGVDDNPHRAGLLATPMPFKDGWATIPDGPACKSRSTRRIWGTTPCRT